MRMFSLLNIAASGLSAASTRVAVTAGNIANMDSAGYQARRVNLISASPAGVGVDSVSLDPSHVALHEDGVEGSNVDITAEVVNLIRDKHQYTASARLLKAGDQMLGSLLDVMAD